MQIDERATAVAGVDRCAGLDQASQDAGGAVGRLAGSAVERADDAERGGLFEAERIADGDGELTDLGLGGIGDGDGLEAGGGRS